MHLMINILQPKSVVRQIFKKTATLDIVKAVYIGCSDQHLKYLHF